MSDPESGGPGHEPPYAGPGGDDASTLGGRVLSGRDRRPARAARPRALRTGPRSEPRPTSLTTWSLAGSLTGSTPRRRPASPAGRGRDVSGVHIREIGADFERLVARTEVSDDYNANCGLLLVW